MTSRRIALVVVPLVVVPLAALAGCARVTIFGPSNTFTDTPALTGPLTQVALDTGSGDVSIAVDPAVTAPALTRRVTFRDQRPGETTGLTGGRLTLRGCDVDNCSIDYQLRLPATVPVDGQGGSGDVELRGVGPVDLNAGSGTVRLDGVTGAARVRVGSGDVRGSGLAGGEVRAEAGSGDVELELRTPENVTATAGSGSIRLTVPRAGYVVQADADSGDVRTDVPSVPGAPYRLTARTGSGDVELRQN